MRWLIAMVALIVTSLATIGARAEVRASVVATDPPGEFIELGRDESLYVHIEFTSDKPVSIWARPFFNGTEVSAKSNASIPHEGHGDALAWFAFNKPGEVDEIRILAGDGSHAGTRRVASYTVKVIGTDHVPRSRARAAWVGELSRQEVAVRRQAYEKRMSEPVTAAESAFMSGFMLTVLALLIAGLAWPAWAMWKWRGGWRAASAIPMVVMGFVVLRVIFDTARDPTSHNLWPFEILMWGAASFAFMFVLKIVRRFARVDG